MTVARRKLANGLRTSAGTARSHRLIVDTLTETSAAKASCDHPIARRNSTRCETMALRFSTTNIEGLSTYKAASALGRDWSTLTRERANWDCNCGPYWFWRDAPAPGLISCFTLVLVEAPAIRGDQQSGPINFDHRSALPPLTVLSKQIADRLSISD